VSAQSHNNLGIYQLNLSLKIWQAANYLVRPRVTIARRAALQNIAYKDVTSFQAAGVDYFIQQFSGSSNERSPLSIFVGTGCFSNKEYASVRIALTRHGVGPQRPQLAFTTSVYFIGEFFKLPGRFSGSRIVLLFRLLGHRVFTFDRKAASKKILHLTMLPNNFINVHVFFHRDEL
jgi:hypothetical protein